MGYIGQAPIRNAFTSPGLWTPNEVSNRLSLGLWEQNDPYWSYVKLLIQPSATDSSITDKSSGAKAVTTSTGALSGSSIFSGGASIANSGSGYACSLADDAGYDGFSDFVIEGFFVANASPAIIAEKAASSSEYGAWNVAVIGNKLRFGASSSNTSEDIAAASTSQSVYSGVTHYFAVSRSGSSGNVYLDGVRGATFSSGTTVYNGSSALYIGGHSNGTYLNGSILSLRITKGTDRGYTGSTIPLPTGPWPTHG